MLSLAENLKYLRERNDLTQTAVAKLLNMTPVGYFVYEVGRTNPPPETLIKLADFYKVSVDYLLGRKQAEIQTNGESNFLIDALRDIRNLPLPSQDKILDFIRMVKIDVAHQSAQECKKIKSVK